MTSTISPAYAEQNRQLHEQRPDYGTSGAKWAAYVETLMREDGHLTVLDFGCGKSTLANALAKIGIPCSEYDPAIPGKDLPPQPADLVVAGDVLEHIEPECLDAVLAELARLAKRKIFFVIAIAPSSKMLPDGCNAHLIVQPPAWWKAKLAGHFIITHWVDRSEGNFVYGEAAPISAAEFAGQSARLRRRKMSPEISATIALIREAGQHADAFSRINSIRLAKPGGRRSRAILRFSASICVRIMGWIRMIRSLIGFTKRFLLCG
jgi:hypothetical protein